MNIKELQDLQAVIRNNEEKIAGKYIMFINDEY